MFILCAVDAPEADALTRLGLTEGPPNTHKGQGTACRRFFFHNAYLELLWVCDQREAQSEGVQPIRLWERWSGRSQGACPFGVVLRSSDDAGTERAAFPTWPYTPSYLPQGFAIDVAVETPLSEPEVFYLGFQRRPAQQVPETVARAIPVRVLTDVSVTTPAPGPQSMAARAAEAHGVLSFNVSSEYVLGLTFDGSKAGRTADLRPDLPLVLHW